MKKSPRKKYKCYLLSIFIIWMTFIPLLNVNASESCTTSLTSLLEENLIDEVLEIPAEAPIPLHFYENYSHRDIAKTLIHKLHQSTYANEDNFYWMNAQIQVLFPLSVLDSIKQNGFLNRPIRFGPDSSAVKAMQKSEDLMIQHKLPPARVSNKELLKIRPIYGFLSIENTTHRNVNLSYGDVFAVLKKEVHSRTTFTAGDSMNISNGGIERPEVHTLFYPKNLEVPLLPNGNAYYYEAQIWGGVDLNDIDHFLVLPSSHTHLKENDILLLKEVGIPVFQAELEYNGLTVIKVKKGAAL